MNNILSAFGFYGGKARMAPLICDMLDYKGTDIYIEPFGGACRVLLNKTRHQREIYNELGIGLYYFFDAMSKPESAKKVISRLYHMEPDRDTFNQMQRYKLGYETDLMEHMDKQFRKLVWKCKKKYQDGELKKLYSHIGKREYEGVIKTSREILGKNILEEQEEIIQFKEYEGLYDSYWNMVGDAYWEAFADADKEEKEMNDMYEKELRSSKRELYQLCHEKGLEAIDAYTADTLVSNSAEQNMDNIEMAIATFITYFFSRDGMGLDYSREKNETLDAYYSRIFMLEEVAERLRGVIVQQGNAMNLIESYCGYKDVMMYLDPSYLSPEKSGDGGGNDLGKGVYNCSFSYDEHLKLAEMIKGAKAKIILSNYDVEPYKGILVGSKGWKKFYFDTTTGVGSKKGNKRTEVLWMNY